MYMQQLSYASNDRQWSCGSRTIQSNLSYPDSCYPGTSLNRAADLPYFMLTLQKLWTVQWVWPITAYVFILYCEIYYIYTDKSELWAPPNPKVPR